MSVYLVLCCPIQREMQCCNTFHFAAAILTFVDKGASGSIAIEWRSRPVCGSQQLMGRRFHYGKD